MDKMRALQYFLKLAETGSYSRTAKLFDVPASSVSRMIQGLEADLGATLVHRTTRVVKLTELGALYLDQVRPAITVLRDADEVIRDQPQAPSGRIRMTAQPGYGGVCLMPALSKLRRQYPDLVIDIELTDQVSNIADNDVDLAVRSTAEPPERSVARKLSDNQFVLVASPDYLDRLGVPATLADLQQHRALLYRRPGGILHWHAKAATGWEDVETSPAFISNMGQALIDEALAGFGLALVPDWGVADHLANGRLVRVVLQDATLSISRNPNLGIYLIYHRPKYRLKKIQVTVDFLISELTEKK